MPFFIMRKNMPIPQRVVIHPRDVENITGKKGRTARHHLQTIKKALGKLKHQFVTVSEFCSFTGLSEELVLSYMVS